MIQSPHGIVNNCERANALADDILLEMAEVERAWLHDPWGVRVRKPSSLNIQDHGEENLDESLVARTNLRSSVFERGSPTLGHIVLICLLVS